MKKSKIFVLITLLITLVMLVSFTVLYFVLPKVYLYSKNHTMNKNTELLTQRLSEATSITECKNLISGFSRRNNAIVFSYDKNGEIISELSSVALMMGEGTVQIRTGMFRVEGNSPPLEVTGNRQGAPGGGSVQSIYIARDNANALFIERDIGSSLIDKISIASTFQPISEAKTVLLILSPFLLLLNVLLGIILAFLYLKREDQYAQNKTDFMRAAHHELKTPIAALSGIIDGMIDNVGVYKNRDEYLPKAKESVERLTLLTNDVLNATQDMDRKVSKEKIDVGELLNEVLEHYRQLLEGKTLLLDKFSFYCKINRTLLKTTISNLASNAIKYTIGEIKIKFENNVFSIENECEQLDEEDLQKVFEPFYTISQSRSREQSGNGIGLYIVKRNLDALKLKYSMSNTAKGIVFEIFF